MKIQKTDKQEERNFYMQCSEQRLIAILLVLTGVISEKDALKSIDLKVVFLFGGSLTLAKALDTTGAGELIADKIVGLLGADPSPILLLLVIFIVTCVLTNFMSNTATTALMIPIAVSLANNLGADPRAVVIATVTTFILFSSCKIEM